MDLNGFDPVTGNLWDTKMDRFMAMKLISFSSGLIVAGRRRQGIWQPDPKWVEKKGNYLSTIPN